MTTARVRRLKNWTQIATPHGDIVEGALDMATYAADLGAVHRGDASAPGVYRDPRAFFQQTYLTRELHRLLRDALAVLAGEPGDQVLQLRTPFGGGKTHTLLALLHVASSRDGLAGLPDVADLPDPGPVRVAVLSGVDLDPQAPRTHDGVTANTLWGELAWQLGGRESYEQIAKQDHDRTGPGRDALGPLLGSGPVLILIDEAMQYVTRSRGVAVGDGTLFQQVMGFVQTLTETVRARPQTALVYSLQKSVAEAGEDEAGLTALEHLVGRMDAVREPVSGDEVMRVVQRRLFADLGEPEERDQAAAEYAKLHEQIALGYASNDEERRQAAQSAVALESRIANSYPFHPALLDCMYHRWGSLPSYQRTRGALQFLARVVHQQWRKQERALPLIGPGDVALDDDGTRGAFFSQVGTRQYDGPIAADITGTASRGREVDRRIGKDAPELDKLRVGTRLATSALLHSFGARLGADRGVFEEELVQSVAAPGLDLGVLQHALSELRSELLYLHSVGRLYRFETTPNLNKLINDGSQAWRGEQLIERVQKELATAIGPDSGAILWPSDPAAVPDRDPRFRLVYLDRRSLAWGGDAAVRENLPAWLERRGGGTMRDFRNALGFAVMDGGAYTRSTQAVRLVLTLEDMQTHAATHQLAPEQREEVRERLGGARADLRTAVADLYDRIALPVADSNGPNGYGWAIERSASRILSGSTLHARLMSLLSERVFDSVTPQRLAGLVQLTEEDSDRKRRFYPCERLVQDAFSYFTFPKLVDREVVVRAVSAGVERGVFGYVPSARIEGEALVTDRRDLVTLGQSLLPEEVDLGEGSFICTPALATELAPPTPNPEPPPAPVPPVRPPGPTPPTPAGATRLRARFRLTPAQLFRIAPGLTALAEASSSCTIDVSLEATASGSGGFDRAFLANSVEEHFLEAGVPWEPEVQA